MHALVLHTHKKRETGLAFPSRQPMTHTSGPLNCILQDTRIIAFTLGFVVVCCAIVSLRCNALSRY